jgi:hypothetical protein
VNIELENKEDDLVFLSQLNFKFNKADECWKCITTNAEKLWNVGYYSANFVLMDPKVLRNN